MSDPPAGFREAERCGWARRRRYTIFRLPTTGRTRRSAHEPSTHRAPPFYRGPVEWFQHQATKAEDASRSERHEIGLRSRVSSLGGKFQKHCRKSKGFGCPLSRWCRGARLSIRPKPESNRASNRFLPEQEGIHPWVGCARLAAFARLAHRQKQRGQPRDL